MTLNLKSITFVVMMSGAVHSLVAENGLDQSWWVPNFWRSAPQLYNPRVGVIEFNDHSDLVKLEYALLSLLKNEEIQGVLLVINHHGGGSDVAILHDFVQRIKRLKPVVGLIKGSAYSAGYWIASAADYLIAHNASEIGSIGACSEVKRFSDIKINKDGTTAAAKTYLFKAGKYKSLYHPWNNDLSEDEKNYIQINLDKAYDLFKNTVAQNRGLDIARAEEWAEGKEFLSSEAFALGLIDEIGTVVEAEAKLLELMSKKQRPGWQMSNKVEYVLI